MGVLILILLWVVWTLLSPLRYYNGFRRSKGEYMRYCWQEETHDFNDSMLGNLKLVA